MKKTYGLLILGSILEYYDYAIYIFFAKSIGSSLIPVGNQVSNLVAAISIFAISALIRPLGGIVFAHNGDKKGRKSSFTITILLMAISTFCIGLIPNQTQIGIWSTLLLLLLRSVQSFAIGGEIPAAMIFAYELSQKNKALNTNIVVSGTNIGLFAASLVCMYLLAYNFELLASWRIAFFIGGFFGIISYFLRKKLHESPEFIKMQSQIKHHSRVPIHELLRKNKLAVIQMTIFACLTAALVAVFSIFMPNYLNTFFNVKLQDAMSLNSYSIFIFIISALLAGKFDYLFGKLFLIFTTIIANATIFFLFYNIQQLDFSVIKSLQFMILIYVGIVCGRLPVIICNFFPTSVRYSGVALSYNISFGIVAGISQLLLISVIKLTACLEFPAYYILIFSILFILFLLTTNAEKLIKYQ